MNKIVDYIKNVVSIIVNFFTGLGFYGVGLLAGGLAAWILLGWSHIGAGLIGAFIFKNFKAIVDYVKGIKL
tara:strand:+ start:11813 stop:12025 length:213 start_codon:yes stop_codon:yes gene_type:complete